MSDCKKTLTKLLEKSKARLENYRRSDSAHPSHGEFTEGVCEGLAAALNILECSKPGAWYCDPHELGVLLLHLSADCTSTDEIRETISFVCNRPNRYQAEYEAAKAAEQRVVTT